MHDRLRNSGATMVLSSTPDGERQRENARLNVCAWALKLPKDEQVDAARELMDMLGL